MSSPLPTTIEPLVEMAGFFAAHGIWGVSDGEALVPMLAYQAEGGKPQMLRLAMDRLEVAVAHGRQWLATNPEGAVHAVTNGDPDAHWRFHLSCERERVNLAHETPDVLPVAA